MHADGAACCDEARQARRRQRQLGVQPALAEPAAVQRHSRIRLLARGLPGVRLGHVAEAGPGASCPERKRKREAVRHWIAEHAVGCREEPTLPVSLAWSKDRRTTELQFLSEIRCSISNLQFRWLSRTFGPSRHPVLLWCAAAAAAAAAPPPGFRSCFWLACHPACRRLPCTCCLASLCPCGVQACHRSCQRLGPPSGIVRACRKQAGRGRQIRTWHSRETLRIGAVCHGNMPQAAGSPAATMNMGSGAVSPAGRPHLGRARRRRGLPGGGSCQRWRSRCPACWTASGGPCCWQGWR